MEVKICLQAVLVSNCYSGVKVNCITQTIMKTIALMEVAVPVIMKVYSFKIMIVITLNNYQLLS